MALLFVKMGLSQRPNTPITHWHYSTAYQITWQYERNATATPAYITNTPGYVAQIPCTRDYDVINVNATKKNIHAGLIRHTYAMCTPCE